MKSTECPLCGTRIQFENPTNFDDLFNCPACHQQLEIVRREPLELMLTKTILDDLEEYFDEFLFGEYPGDFALLT